VTLLFLIACRALFAPEPPSVDRSDAAAHLTGNFRTDAPDIVRFGGPHGAPASSVQAVRFDAPDGFSINAALWTPDAPTGVGVVVAHGHYGQGKSSPEAQEIAHRLAARGVWVIAVDSPGVEEGDRPERQIHFADGAHNRGFLVSGGSSALALQLSGIQAAVSLLEEQGVESIGVTGASGGAVASFYIGWLDARVDAVVLAAPPPIPREAAASGCPCDHIPGHPGPDPGMLAQLTIPSLWMADVKGPRPDGLSGAADFRIFEGPHSYTESMQRAALEFFEVHLGVPGGPWVKSVPLLNLSTGTDPGTTRSVMGLPLQTDAQWTPAPTQETVAQVSCEGEGKVVLALGHSSLPTAVRDAYRVCSVSMPAPGAATWDESAWVESIGRGSVRADAVLGAVMAAAKRHDAVAIWAHRVWALVAGPSGLPFVVHDPVRDSSRLQPSDPAWVHVPGAWTGVIDRELNQALAVSDDVDLLVAALNNASGG